MNMDSATGWHCFPILLHYQRRERVCVRVSSWVLQCRLPGLSLVLPRINDYYRALVQVSLTPPFHTQAHKCKRNGKNTHTRTLKVQANICSLSQKQTSCCDPYLSSFYSCYSTGGNKILMTILLLVPSLLFHCRFWSAHFQFNIFTFLLLSYSSKHENL